MSRHAVSRRFLRCVAAVALAATAGCVSPTAPRDPPTTAQAEYRVDGILFTASARMAGIEGRTLEVTLRAVNETDFWAETGILGGPCMLRPRLYTAEVFGLAWSAFDLHEACPDPLELIRLDGGDERHITRHFEAFVAPGDYLVTLTIEHAGALVELTAGTVTMP